MRKLLFIAVLFYIQWTTQRVLKLQTLLHDQSMFTERYKQAWKEADKGWEDRGLLPDHFGVRMNNANPDTHIYYRKKYVPWICELDPCIEEQ